MAENESETESDGEPPHGSCFQSSAVTIELCGPILPKRISELMD